MRRIKNTVLYLLYLLIITFVIGEVAIRVVTTKNKAGVDLFLGKKHRYLLPLPHKATDSTLISKLTTSGAYRIFHDTLGWSHGIWQTDTIKSPYPLFSNNKGMRISKTSFLKKEKALKHYKILTIGDSFTHGDAVKCEESWPYLLAQKLNCNYGNLGVGGYGIDQALLRLMHEGITADTVLFGVIWGDFERALEPVYTFYTGDNKTKPYFSFAANGYEVKNLPVKTPAQFYAAKEAHTDPIFQDLTAYNEDVFSDATWTYSYLMRLMKSSVHHKQNYRPKPVYLTNDENLEYCLNIFKLFADYCTQNDMYGKIVLLDTGQNFGHKKAFGLNNPWDLVTQKLSALNIEYVEFHQQLYTAFSKDRHALIHAEENLHYSPEGNQLVADLLFKHFNKN